MTLPCCRWLMSNCLNGVRHTYLDFDHAEPGRELRVVGVVNFSELGERLLYILRKRLVVVGYRLLMDIWGCGNGSPHSSMSSMW